MRRLLLTEQTKERLKGANKFLGGPGNVTDSDGGYISDKNLQMLERWRRPDESDDALLNRILDFIDSKRVIQFPQPKEEG